MLEYCLAPTLRIAQDPLDQQEFEESKVCLPTGRDVLTAKTLKATCLKVMESMPVDRLQDAGHGGKTR